MDWNGYIFKHRDYQHSSFVEHARANGGVFSRGTTRMLDRNPVTYEVHDEDKKYLEVTLDYHGDEYTYYVPINDDGSRPTEDQIDEFIQRYVDNPIPEGRDPIDFLAAEELASLDNPPSGVV